MVLTLEFNNIFYHGRQKNLVKLFCFIVFFHSVNGPPPRQTTTTTSTTTTSTTTTTTTTRNYTLNPAMFDPLPNCPMCDVPSGSVGVILDALWNQSSPSYSMPPTAASCSLENGDATVSYWSSTTVEPPVPSIGSYPSVANSNQQAYVFSSNRGTCLTPCFCTFDGSCYSPSNYTDFLVTFIPYCDSSGICIMYAVDQTYNPTNNGQAWFSDSGTQTPNLDPRVVPVGPDSPYPETKSFGCNGCDRLRALACPVTSTTDMTTTSSTTTTTTTPVPTTTSSMTTTTPSTTTTTTPTPTTTLTSITTTAETITTTPVPTTTLSMTTTTPSITTTTMPTPTTTLTSITTTAETITTTPIPTTTLSMTTTTPSTTTMTMTTPTTSTTTTTGCTISSMGCYTDNAIRILPVYMGSFSQNSPTFCSQICAAAGFIYAGMEVGTTCFCGNCLNFQAAQKSSNAGICYQTCSGDSSKYCGGPWAINIYSTDCNTTEIPCSPNCANSYLGCYTDDANQRLLGSAFYDLTGVNTPVKCAQTCAQAGYVYAGVENTVGCFCGDDFNFQVARPADNESRCNAPCPGDSSKICGAYAYINVYSTAIAECTTTTSSATTTSTSSTSTTSTSTTSITITSIAALTTTTTPTTTTTTSSTSTITPTTTTTTTSSTTTSTTTTPTTTSTTTNDQCCQIGGVWSEWSDSGACSDTCGSCGLITRTRTCLSSPNCPCSGPSSRLDNCNVMPCTYPRLSCCTPYNEMKLANGTIICGPQTDPFEPESLITGCMPNCCPAQGVWSQWSEPSGCSDTCGACGVGTRQRYCMTEGNRCPCTGADTQNVPCNLMPCKYPRNSCCIGEVQNINGAIICSVTTSIETPASLACTTTSVCCPSGGTWSEWSTSQTCSDTCGSCAQLTYTRTCISGPTCPCSGNPSKTVNCNLAPCLYPKNSCCGSYKTMFASGQAICGPQPVEPADTPSDSIVCTTVPGAVTGSTATCAPGGEWSSWTQGTCSDICGMCGTQINTRTCLSQSRGCPCSGSSTESVACAPADCKYPRPTCCSEYTSSKDSFICVPKNR